MAEEKVRKTTAKKTVRRTTTKVAPRKTPVRRTAASTGAASSATSPRKAPLRSVTSAQAPQRKNKTKLVAVILFFVVVLGASLGIGFSDQGQINVNDVIATRKQNATPEEKQVFETIPVQQSQTNVVNGGLVGSSDQSEQRPPVEEVAPAATSTEQATTSTEVSPSEETQQTQEPQSEETATPTGEATTQ